MFYKTLLGFIICSLLLLQYIICFYTVMKVMDLHNHVVRVHVPKRQIVV